MKPLLIGGLFIICFIFILTAPAMAEGGRFTVGGDVGAIYPIFNHNDTDKFEVDPALCYGTHIAYGVSDHASLKAGWLFAIQDVRIDGDEDITMMIQDIQLGGQWIIFTGSIRPMVFMGMSYYIINLEEPLKDDSNFGLHGGVGMEFFVTKRLSLGVLENTEYVFLNEFEYALSLSGLAFVNFTF